MELQTTIEMMISHWPGSVANRTDALERLFCMYGTGYHWENGQLVNAQTCKEGGIPDAPTPGAREELAQLVASEAPEQREQLLAGYDRAAGRRMALRNELLAISQRSKELSLSAEVPAWIHPLCKKYSPLANVPDDVRQDWLDAAHETLDLIEKIDPEGKTGRVCGMLQRASEDQVARARAAFGADLQETLELARKIRRSLARRFPGKKAKTAPL